ncbi:MAG: TauD/TfdA family dioxygenase [Nitrococcus sp.]|nr:TauD/TfdA family dioxygenase [Nitrococcus sp.]
MIEAAKVPGRGCRLPVIVKAPYAGASWKEIFVDGSQRIDDSLCDAGGVLFRGFTLENANALHDLVTAFGAPLLSYDFASTPRSHVGNQIYTSTEYPASQSIPLHNEQSYTRDWPMRIWFHCVTPAQSGGDTPIADSRAIYREIPAKVRDRFIDKQLMYVRNYGNGLDLPWQAVFNTDRKDDVETYCRAHQIAWDWKPDGSLRTRQTAQAVAEHPLTGDPLWFNQAHLFHVSSLQPSVRQALLDAVDESDIPRNVYHADGTSIDEGDLDAIRSVIARHTISFAWQRDDVLMLDNMLTAHGRTPFKGNRKVLVAMACPYSEHTRAQ